MKKTTLAVSAAALAALLAGPKIVSGNVSAQLEQLVEEINKNPAYAAKLSNVQSGWFSTNADIEVTIDLSSFNQDPDNKMPEAFENTTVMLDFEAHHGPVILNDGLHLALAKWQANYSGKEMPEEFSWDKSQPFYSLRGKLGLGGSTELSDSIPAFTVSEDSGNFEFSGYQGEGTLSNDGFKYLSSAESATFTGDKAAFAVEGIAIDMNLQGSWEQVMGGMMYDSNSSFRIASISDSRDASAREFNLNDVVVTAISDMDDDAGLAGIIVKYGIGSFRAGEYSGEQIAMDVEMKNINADFLMAYQKFAQQLHKYNEQELAEKTQEFVEGNLLDLLSATPEMNLTRFEGKLSQGSFDGKMDSKLVGIDALPENVLDPGFWLQHLVANLDLTLDKGLLEFVGHHYMVSQLKANPQTATMTAEQIEQIAAQQLPMMINNFQQQGLMLAEGETYKTSFSLADGQATLNGNPMPLPMGTH